MFDTSNFVCLSIKELGLHLERLDAYIQRYNVKY